jgi:hypothetical protein
MRKPIAAIFFLTLMFTIVSAVSMADTITISTANIRYTTNEGPIKISSSAITNTYESAKIEGNYFSLSASGNYGGGDIYRNAGIVLYSGGGLRLGDLQSINVNGTGGPISIALWLDTGGGGFFTLNQGIATFSANDKQVFINNTTTLNASSSLSMFGTSGTYTLDALQAALGSNTPVAIWIGVENVGGPHTAFIDTITVNRVPEPSLLIMLGIGFGATGLISRRWR